MNIMDNIRVALKNLQANKGRATLTILIIAVGIVALVAILTALDVLIFSLSDNFSRLGANSFNIEPASQVIQTNDGGRTRKTGEPIIYDQAIDFKERFEYPSTISVSFSCSDNIAIKFGEKKTNPTMSLVAVDENYISTSGYDLEHGRNFSPLEITNAHNRVILGNSIAKTLFGNKLNQAINATVIVGSARYKVIGVLASKGSSMNQFADRVALIPLSNGKAYYGKSRTNYSIAVSVTNSVDIDEAVSNATGLFRNIRNLRLSQENDFEINKSDGLIDLIKENTVKIRLGIIFIAIITLLGAAIGLMNIMLVSVTERTREIGIVKAVGATQRNILTQFLTEAVVICQVGSIVGIIFGVLVGFGVSAIIGGRYIIPWNWMILAIFISLITGLVSGLYPALKAARLDPIESLRYE